MQKVFNQGLFNQKKSPSKWMVYLLVFLMHVTLAIGHYHQWKQNPDSSDNVELISDIWDCYQSFVELTDEVARKRYPKKKR